MYWIPIILVDFYAREECDWVAVGWDFSVCQHIWGPPSLLCDLWISVAWHRVVWARCWTRASSWCQDHKKKLKETCSHSRFMPSGRAASAQSSFNSSSSITFYPLGWWRLIESFLSKQLSVLIVKMIWLLAEVLIPWFLLKLHGFVRKDCCSSSVMRKLSLSPPARRPLQNSWTILVTDLKI